MVFILFFLLSYAPTLYSMQRLEAHEHRDIIQKVTEIAEKNPVTFYRMFKEKKDDGTFKYNAPMLAAYAANQIQAKNKTHVIRQIREKALEAIPYQKAHTPTVGCDTRIDCLIPDQKPEMGAIAAGIEIDIGKGQSARLFSTHLGALVFAIGCDSHIIVPPQSFSKIQEKFNNQKWNDWHLIKKSSGIYEIDEWLNYEENFPQPYTTLALNKNATLAAAAKECRADIYDLAALRNKAPDRTLPPLRTVDLSTFGYYTRIPLLAFSPSGKKCTLVAELLTRQESTEAIITDLVIAPVEKKSKDFTVFDRMRSENSSDFPYSRLEWDSDNIIFVTRKANPTEQQGGLSPLSITVHEVGKQLIITPPVLDIGDEHIKDIEQALPGLLRTAPPIEKTPEPVILTRGSGCGENRNIKLEQYKTGNYTLSAVTVAMGAAGPKLLSAPMQRIIQHILIPSKNTDKKIAEDPNGFLYAYAAARLFGGPKEMRTNYLGKIRKQYERPLGVLSTGSTAYLTSFGTLYTKKENNKNNKSPMYSIKKGTRQESDAFFSKDDLRGLAVADEDETRWIRNQLNQKWEKIYHAEKQKIILDKDTIHYLNTTEKQLCSLSFSDGAEPMPPLAVTIDIASLYNNTASCEVERLQKVSDTKVAILAHRLSETESLFSLPTVYLVDESTSKGTLYPTLEKKEINKLDSVSIADFSLPIHLNSQENPEVHIKTRSLLDYIFPRVRTLYADKNPTEYRLYPFWNPIRWTSCMSNKCFSFFKNMLIWK
jgi:hypothetical protein